ncbi:uncharacterized protein LOC114517599 [Dendronephthya gigantea]|uniref:uncharacterized protein LOC114517599 n=1 Tax=Dendronephthya gigantea TaxID=151771 RepID=UPI00106957E5|nr:uncharacterized protein LOC114517599 [Dendronephthya gigantea]
MKLMFLFALAAFVSFSHVIVEASCPTITFPCDRIPDVCDNMRDAINSGKPSTLNRITNPTEIAKNRRDSGCPNLIRVPGENCDEYPFASSRQGGRGAAIRNVPKRQNSIQGGLLGSFYKDKNIGDGDCYTVALSRSWSINISLNLWLILALTLQTFLWN